MVLAIVVVVVVAGWSSLDLSCLFPWRPFGSVWLVGGRRVLRDGGSGVRCAGGGVAGLDW